jgi:hypothetical protein
MSRKLTSGCYSKLASAKETTGAKVKSTVNYPESLEAISRQLETKIRIIGRLNFNTLQWLNNKE